MKRVIVRLVVSALIFLAFTWASTAYYMTYIHDVGGTYWAMGIFGLPVVLLTVWGIDSYLKNLTWFKDRLGMLVFIDSMLAIALYYLGFVVVWGLIYVLGIT
ncbi:MAG: hypothetical protein P1U57_06315 [Oleibacter sp.]|nr:hypothetical protein [Thalassolituus sp.]